MTENDKQNTSKQTDQLATDTFNEDLLDLFPSLKTEQTQQDVEAMLWLARARSIPGRFDTVFSFFFNRGNQTSSQALERLKHVVTASEQLGSYDAFLTLYEHYPNKPAFFSQLPMLLDAYETLGSLSELTALLSHDSSRQHNLSTLDVPKSVTKDKGQDRTPIRPILPPNRFDQFIVQIQPSFSLEKIRNDLSKNREHASPALEAILNDLDSLLLLAHAGTVVGSYEAVFNLFFSFPFQNKSEFVPNFTLVVDACQQLGSYHAYMDIYKSYPFPDKKAFVKNLPLITEAYEALGSYRELLDVFKRFPYKSEKELFTALRSIVKMFPQEKEPVEDVEKHNPSSDALPHYRHDLLFVPKLFEIFKSFPELQRVLLITTPNPIDLNKLRIIWQSIAADSFSDKAVALTRILENVAQAIAQPASNELALWNQEIDNLIDHELSIVNELNRFLSEIQEEHDQHHSLNIDFSHSRAEIFSRITWAFREYLEKPNPLSKAQVLRLAETVWEKCPKGAEKAVEFWANITFIAELVEKEKVDFSEIIDTLLGTIDLSTFRKQALLMLKTRNERTQTFSTVAPLKPDSDEESQVEKLPKVKHFSSNHKTVEIFSTSSADGTPQKRYFIRIQPQTNVTFLPLGSGRPPQRYQPGLTEVTEYPFHGLCIIDEPDKIATVALNESSTSVYQIRPNEQRPHALELQQSPQLAKEHPLQQLQQEMLAEVVSWAHTQERIATPDFLISLWRAIPELAKDTNRAVHMHTIIKQLDANYTLKSSEHGSMLCERWKDLIQGIFLEGWVASTQAQQFVEQLYKSGRLSKEETQTFLNTTFLADELQHLYKKWLNSSLISEQEYQMLTAQERYAVGGGCIWTLSEAIATNFADITHKQAFHEQLTELCYQEKSKNGTISFEQFKQLVSDKLFEGNRSHPVLNQELVWEYLYSEVTGNYAAVQEALFNRVLEVVKTDALIGEAPSERKNAARQKGGKSIDTLRYRPHAQTLCIKFKQSELLSEDNPLKWYFRARNQSFDIVQQITVPLHPTNDAGLIAALETSTESDDDEFTFRQEQIQDSIYLLGLTQLILGRETPETLALGKTTEQVLDEMLDLIKTQAFPGQETPASDLEDSARNVFIRLMDASRGQNAKQLLQSSNTYSEERWQLASTGKKGITGVLETFQASTPEEFSRAKKQLEHMFRALMSSNTPLHEELKQDFMKLVNQYLNTSAQTEQITQLYLARLLRSKKRGVYGKHGWGGTLHVHEPFIDTLTSQDRDVLVITESFMNSEGTGELDGLVTKRTDNSLSNPTTPNNDSTNPTEFTPTGTLSTKIPLLGQPHFGSYGAQEIEVLKRSGLLTYERVALFGHSMSGNISLQGVLRVAEEILNKVDFYVFTGVVTNNEKKVSMKRFFSIVQKHPWLAEIVTASQSYQRLLKEMKIAPVISESKNDSLTQLLTILNKKDRYIQHYTGLLNFDRTAAFTTSIAGGITYSVSAESTVLPGVVDAAQKLMVTAGDIIGLNQRVYSWLVENCHPEAAAEHAVQLVENITSFISHVTTILNNVKEFTPEEMALLKERMQHFTMVFATGDKVLKYPFGVVMWEEFIDRMIFAVNDPDSPNREPGHYAHTDIEANRELIAKHMVASLHQTAYSTIIALLDAQEKTHRSTQVLPDSLNPLNQSNNGHTNGYHHTPELETERS